MVTAINSRRSLLSLIDARYHTRDLSAATHDFGSRKTFPTFAVRRMTRTRKQLNLIANGNISFNSVIRTFSPKLMYIKKKKN